MLRHLFKTTSHNRVVLTLRLACLLCSLQVLSLSAQSTHWRVEAESPKTRVLWRGDTLDVTSPQGVSLWWDEPMELPAAVSYRACVVVQDGCFDRLSDLNSFMLASDPLKPTPMHGIAQRGGRFVESYRLKCYYLGYGGNYNTTTRFRRYTADTLGVADVQRRPPVLVEYTDPSHLLLPNHWYSIKITAVPEGTAARIRYEVDGECIVDYLDTTPLSRGWFALRSTWSHLRVTQFVVSKPQ
ncbi:MAG: hypothetical protein J5486_02795 [Bacteroidaceae bacterium]|nr:hypothetical protein [Bacteroidaceae bacterium]